MRFVAGPVNKELLANYTTLKTPDCSEVKAAVAYASRDQLQLFNECHDKGKPLTFYGRYDQGVPVAPEVIKWFLDKASPNCICRLVPNMLHAKVIWWVGVGVYIGSANLSDRAWNSNIEAGTYHDQEEIETTSLYDDLVHFFATVDKNSQPVDNKVYNHLLDLKRARESIEDAEEKIRRRIKPIFPPAGFTTVPPPGKAAREQRKFEAFQKSWRESIQALQDISTRVTKDEYRPDWVPVDTPPFLQADQFIHAYYFIKIGGHRGEAFVNAAYEEHKGNPEGALVKAMQWWKQSEFNYGEEYKHMVPWAKVMRDAFAENRIQYLTKAEFVDALSKVHAIRAYGGKLVTAIGAVETADEKVLRHADRLWDVKSANGTSILELLDYVIWDRDEIERRVWNGINDPERKIPGLGYSALGEIVGWARPDTYPPRNDRSIKGMRALGIQVRAVA